jgi:hypothetical protein
MRSRARRAQFVATGSTGQHSTRGSQATTCARVAKGGAAAPQTALLTLLMPPERREREAGSEGFINPPADGSMQFSVNN